MTLKCGIVGLPNVGKSTLFNALNKNALAESANYPFCTIERNTGVVSVPDKRLYQLAENVGSAKIIPAFIELVDIAGLVKGASKGEGLGNKFLSHIREVDAIIHVLRCFDDPDITHIHGKIDPIEDAEVIETELMIADLDSIDKRIIGIQKKAKSGDKNSKGQLLVLEDCLAVLKEGNPVRILTEKYTKRELASLQLLTSKPVLYVCNVLESEAVNGNNYSQMVEQKAALEGVYSVIICSKIEAEIASFEEEEKREFLNSIGLKETGLSKIIKTGYKLLGLKSFFTIGPKEAHAWTFEDGARAHEAAGIIHSDFEKGFIRAEVISCNDYLKIGSEAKAKEIGKIRVEGKEYVMQDGDVVYFRFNV